MSDLKTFFRLLLGLFMTYAGFSHLTFNRQEFVAQVPTWLQFSEGFTDFVLSELVAMVSRNMMYRCSKATNIAKTVVSVLIPYAFLDFVRHSHHSFSCCQPPVLQRARKIRTGWMNRRIRRRLSVLRPKASM